MSKLRSLKETFSPLSYVYMAVAGLGPLLVIFRPSLIEAAGVILVDYLAAMVMIQFEGRIFTKFFPDTALFFPKVDEVGISKLETEEKVALYESMSRFPVRRAIFVFFMDYPKMVPAWLLVIFWWDYEGSVMRQALLIMTYSTYMNIFVFQSLFVESHVFLSDLIERLHKDFDWREVFLTAPISGLRRHFEVQEKINLAMLFLVMLLLQSIVIITWTGEEQWYLLFQVITIGLMTLLLLVRVWSMGRQYIFGGLSDLFATMDTVDYKDQKSVLPLHTAEILAKFERSFNELVARLQKSEQELLS